MTSRRKFIRSLIGVPLLVPQVKGALQQENSYESILTDLVHEQHITPGDSISIIRKNWETTVDEWRAVFGAKFHQVPMAHLSIHNVPTYPGGFFKSNPYLDDKNIIETLLLKSSIEKVSGFPMPVDLITCGNRIACRNRRGVADVMVCNPINYDRLKDIHPEYFKVISSEFIPINKILMLYKGSVAWDGVGVIAVNKADPRYVCHYFRDIQDYATTISWS